MINTAALYSSSTDEWETPQDLFNQLDGEFHFTLDVCATPQNTKCVKYFTKEQDGLTQDWRGETVWCNPPYGKQIGDWMRRLYEFSTGGGHSSCPRTCEDGHAMVS